MIVLFLLGITAASAAEMSTIYFILYHKHFSTSDIPNGHFSIYIIAKLLVVTGDPTFEAQKTEVIDISDPDNICDSLGDYPLEAASGFGGMLNGMPVSCGGFNPDIDGYALKDCYKLEEVLTSFFKTQIVNNSYLDV